MGFEFKYFLNQDKSIIWNPDTTQNGHLMITGGSGSGKTRLVKEIMDYLYFKGKNIHVIDVQNTLKPNCKKRRHSDTHDVLIRTLKTFASGHL